MGVLKYRVLRTQYKYGVRNPATIDELHQYIRISGRPRKVLEKGGYGEQGRIRKLTIPQNIRGLLWKIKNIHIDYQMIKIWKSFFRGLPDNRFFFQNPFFFVFLWLHF